MAEPATVTAPATDHGLVRDLATVAAGFGAALHSDRLPVGPDRSQRFARAVTIAGPPTIRELYWCGLATLAVAGRSPHRVGEPADPEPEIPPGGRGMAAAWPYCDAVVSAHRLTALAELMAALADPARPRRISGPRHIWIT